MAHGEWNGDERSEKLLLFHYFRPGDSPSDYDTMPLLDRFSFSISRSVHINAPIDDVWQVLRDVQSYPLWCSSIADVTQTRQGSVRRSTNSDENNSITIDFATTPSQISGVAGCIQVEADDDRTVQAEALTNRYCCSSPYLIGSTWKITRISVVENSRYSCTASITQCSADEEQQPGEGEGEGEVGCTSKKRSILTFSAHEMLGATFSLRFTVESNPEVTTLQNNINEDSTAANTTPATNTNNNRQSCLVNAIVTMVPYQFFVKLPGIMCCLCLLKYRARMALECDLEELAIYCEERAATDAAAEATAIGATAIEDAQQQDHHQ